VPKGEEAECAEDKLSAIAKEEVTPVKSESNQLTAYLFPEQAKEESEQKDLGTLIAELKKAGDEVDVGTLDIAQVSDVDEAEIDKMLLREDEKALKTRIWNELNS
jgi:hypothetical protein